MCLVFCVSSKSYLKKSDQLFWQSDGWECMYLSNCHRRQHSDFFQHGKDKLNSFFLVPCSAGTFLDPMKSSCTDCPVGTYKEIPENVDCTPCPSGKSTETTGSRSITSCLSKYNLITAVESFKFVGDYVCEL